MNAFRFIHAADLHVDSPFRGLKELPASLRSRAVESTFAAWDALVDLAVREQAAFVVVSGDLYDGKDRSLKAQWRLQRGMERLAAHRIAVYLIHGNHDPLHEGVQWAWPDNVTVFGTGAPGTALARGAEGTPLAVIAGMSYGESAVRDNLAARYPSEPEKALAAAEADGLPERARLFRIGMLHGTIDGRPGHDPYAPCSKRELIAAGYDYWALGHIHLREVLHASPYIVYPGNTQGRHVKETGAKGAYVVEVDERHHVSLRFEPLDEVRWCDEAVDIADLADMQQVMERLDAALVGLRQQNGSRLVFARLTLVGRTALYRELHRQSLEQQWAAAANEQELERMERSGSTDGIWIAEVRTRCRPDLDPGVWMESDSFLGDLVRLADRGRQDSALRDELLAEALRAFQGQPRLRQWLADQPEEAAADWLQEAMLLLLEALHEGGSAS